MTKDQGEPGSPDGKPRDGTPEETGEGAQASDPATAADGRPVPDRLRVLARELGAALARRLNDLEKDEDDPS